MFADEYAKIYGSSSRHAPAESSATSASTSASTQSSQPLVQAYLQRILEKKKINDSRAQKYHYLIGEMIAIDNEPLSIVDHHEGFKRLLNNALPQHYSWQDIFH